MLGRDGAVYTRLLSRNYRLSKQLRGIPNNAHGVMPPCLFAVDRNWRLRRHFRNWRLRVLCLVVVAIAAFVKFVALPQTPAFLVAIAVVATPIFAWLFLVLIDLLVWWRRQVFFAVYNDHVAFLNFWGRVRRVYFSSISSVLVLGWPFSDLIALQLYDRY